jgi:phage terminase small subunit
MLYDPPMENQNIPNGIPKAKPRPKLTREQIREGLKSQPMDALLLGAGNAKKTTLTAKQQKFAQALASGETKAGAYRAAYDTKTNPHAQSIEGQRLAANPSIALQVDALRLAAEARAYATPPALRALVLERLTAHAIDPDVKPAQRLRALELLGKVTEVAAFTERRELVKVTDSGQARTKLIQTLRDAMRAGAVDAVILEPGFKKANAINEIIEVDQDPNPAPDCSVDQDEPVTINAVQSSEPNDPGAAA